MRLRVWDFDKSALDPTIDAKTSTEGDLSRGGPYTHARPDDWMELVWHMPGNTLVIEMRSFEVQDVIKALSDKLKGSTVPDYAHQYEAVAAEPSKESKESLAALAQLKAKVAEIEEEAATKTQHEAFAIILGLTENQEVTEVRPVGYEVTVRTHMKSLADDAYTGNTCDEIVTVSVG